MTVLIGSSILLRTGHQDGLASTNPHARHSAADSRQTSNILMKIHKFGKENNVDLTDKPIAGWAAPGPT